MASVVISGDTSGSVTLSAPTVAGSSTQTLVAATGTLAPIISGTSQASTSGTAIDFTGIPSWAKRITIIFNGVSTTGAGTRQVMVQVGTGGTATTSGYLSAANSIVTTTVSSNTSTSAFILESSGAAGANAARSGSVVISNISGNTWISNHVIASQATAATSYGGGSVTLSGVLDMVRITTSPTTDPFDAGSINIMYE